jgi:WD40 repeat protein
VKVWNPRTGEEIRTIEVNSPVKSIAVNPTSDRIVVGTCSNITEVFDLSGKRVLHLHPTDAGTSVAFSPNGKWIGVGGWGRRVQLWTADTGEKVRDFNGANQTIHQLAFSPNGKQIAVGTGWEGFEEKVLGEIIVWDIEKPEPRFILKGHTSKVYDLSFSSDGTVLASAGGMWNDGTKEYVGGEVRLWSLRTGNLVRILRGHQRHIEAVAFSSDGKYLATAADDHTTRLWKPVQPGAFGHEWEEVRKWRNDSQTVHRLAFSPDSSMLAAANQGFVVQVWTVEEPKRD